MSVHYLVDMFGNPVTTARIIDVRDPLNLQSEMNGAFIIRVPNGVVVQRPTSVTDLLTQKYQGLLAENAGFTHITFDDLLDGTHVDPTSGPGFLGQRGTISLAPGGVLKSVVTPLTGGAPVQALITWEVYSVTDVDPSNAGFTRTYVELSSVPSNATCQVSFNSGATYNPITDSTILNIPALDQGTNFVIQLTNATTGRLYVGSWAVIY